MQAAAEAAGHDDWDGYIGDKMQAAAKADGHDDWKGYIGDKMQASAEAAGFSSHSAHLAAHPTRGKGKQSVMDRAVKRQAELNSISGGGWTISFVKATA